MAHSHLRVQARQLSHHPPKRKQETTLIEFKPQTEYAEVLAGNVGLRNVSCQHIHKTDLLILKLKRRGTLHC
jgi:hypothetical protein